MHKQVMNNRLRVSVGLCWTDRRTAYLYNLVFLGFIDLTGQAAASDSVMYNELIRLETRLFV